MLDWAQLVEERNAWVSHNFPLAMKQPEETIWGCMEELGELTHAHLKERQNIRGSAETHQAAAKDAVGDLTVYLMGCMHHSNLFPGPYDLPATERPPGTADEALLGLGHAVGKLCTAYLCVLTHDEIEADYRYATGINKVVYLLDMYCSFRKWDYEALVLKTWEHVKTRDWIQYPDTGLAPEHGNGQAFSAEPEAADDGSGPLGY